MSFSDFPQRCHPIRVETLAALNPEAPPQRGLLRLAEERWLAGCGCMRDDPAFDALWLCCDGLIRVQWSDGAFVVQPGDIALLPARCSRRAQVSRRRNLHLLVIHARGEPELFGSHPRRLAGMPAVLEELLRQTLAHGDQGPIGAELAQTLWRGCCHLIRVNEPNDRASTSAVARYHACRERLLATSPAVTTEDAARLCELTVDHLNRLFSRFAGESCSAWLRRRRLQQAARLLLEDTDRTLAGVATACGYADAFALSKAFKRHFGLAPRNWRQLALTT